ncbi:hypothetical protein [Chthonobacter albigriseus]|uniref:hypothetical protein n=1 Tax=Chthonobacter albigriseus TaxID=1683161 RepID=UPI0015EF01D0|nr:hypothetical protein [Chthonobacter albigriseus]
MNDLEDSLLDARVAVPFYRPDGRFDLALDLGLMNNIARIFNLSMNRCFLHYEDGSEKRLRPQQKAIPIDIVSRDLKTEDLTSISGADVKNNQNFGPEKVINYDLNGKSDYYLRFGCSSRNYRRASIFNVIQVLDQPKVPNYGFEIWGQDASVDCFPGYLEYGFGPTLAEKIDRLRRLIKNRRYLDGFIDDAYPMLILNDSHVQRKNFRDYIELLKRRNIGQFQQIIDGCYALTIKFDCLDEAKRLANQAGVIST